MTLILFLILFILLTIIPFLVSIIELKYPKDDKPLYINMESYKDPEYFSKSFKKMIENKVDNTIHFMKNFGEIELSKKEIVELSSSKLFEENSIVNNVQYVATDLKSEQKVIFQKEVYIKGKAEIGPENVIRSLYSEGNIIIREKTRIIRWVHSENNLIIEEGSNLGASVSCKKTIRIGKNTRFVSIFGNPIISVGENVRGYNTPIPQLKYQRKEGEYGRWLIADKNLIIHAYIHEDDDSKQLRKEIAEKRAKNFIISRSSVVIPTNTKITGDFVIKKDLYISDYCSISSNIKCYGNIKIGNMVKITGNIFAEGDIHIDKFCSINGNVFSQSAIFSKEGLVIGNAKYIKSIIGKKKVVLNGCFSIFGNIHTEGFGEIN